MECTPVEEKEATVRVLEWAGAECLYQVRVRRLEAWTTALIQDADSLPTLLDRDAGDRCLRPNDMEVGSIRQRHRRTVARGIAG